MRVVLSRKGNDSSAGRFPSPILPDGTLVSVPIPEPVPGTGLTYEQVVAPDGRKLLDLLDVETRGWPRRWRQPVEGLLRQPGREAHLDPDLDPKNRKRDAGFAATLGQNGAAQAHLRNEGVGPGDLFLFYGWFAAAPSAGDLFGRDPDGCHVVWGWLQVNEVVDATVVRARPALAGHPHVVQPLRSGHNVLYVAGSGPDSAGLLRWSPARRLSSPGGPRSRWALPPKLRMTRHRQEHVLERGSEGERWALSVLS